MTTGIDHTGEWTPAQFVVDMQYSLEDVQTIAKLGSMDAAEEAAELTAGERAEVIAYCKSRVKESEFTAISISMDSVWAGSGKLVDGRIEDCGAQFCDDNDESLGVYDAIEAAIAMGKTHIKVAFRGDHKQHEITWTITEPS